MVSTLAFPPVSFMVLTFIYLFCIRLHLSLLSVSLPQREGDAKRSNGCKGKRRRESVEMTLLRPQAVAAWVNERHLDLRNTY